MGHLVPQRLRPFQILTRFLRTFSATVESVSSAATTRQATATGVKQILIGSEASAARDVLGCFAQSVDPAPSVNGQLLVRGSFCGREVCRALRTYHSTG